VKIAFLVPDNRDEFRRYSDPEPYFGPAPSALLSGLEAMPECEIHIVCCSHFPMSAPAKLARNIYFHLLLVPKIGWLRGVYLGCTRAIRRKLLEIKPDVVHGQGTERYCALAAVHSGFPNVLTIHGNMREIANVNRARPFSFLWLAAFLETWALARTWGVFCNSVYTRQLVMPLARTTWMVPNALREVFFSPLQGDLDSPPVLLNVGVITPRKAQNELLALAARLHQQEVRFQLQFIGELDERTAYGAEFRSRINQAQQQGFASYLGQMSEGDLAQKMDRAAGLIHIPKEEAFGLVVAEGLSRNLKLFGTKVGGIIDIAEGVDGAELFQLGDTASLEASILKWLSIGAPKIKNGAKAICERYHPSVIARKHFEIYHQVVNGCLQKPGSFDARARG